MKAGWYTAETEVGRSKAHFFRGSRKSKDEVQVSVCGLLARDPEDLDPDTGADKCGRCNKLGE